MDDDIRLEPDTVVRLRALADRADEPIIVGGQMLNLLHPRPAARRARRPPTCRILRAGLPVDDALVDADVTEEQQDVRVDAAYNAWWTCLIPSEVVEAIGYPLPLFFQWDDIEYGLRARGAGFPTVTLPGAGVWHADFSWKNWDDWSRYFSFRNSLITSALHSDFDRRRIVDHLARQLIDYLVSMRYGLAALTLRAVEDFLRGPDVLPDGGAETVRRRPQAVVGVPGDRQPPGRRRCPGIADGRDAADGGARHALDDAGGAGQADPRGSCCAGPAAPRPSRSPTRTGGTCRCSRPPSSPTPRRRACGSAGSTATRCSTLARRGAARALAAVARGRASPGRVPSRAARADQPGHLDAAVRGQVGGHRVGPAGVRASRASGTCGGDGLCWTTARAPPKPRHARSPRSYGDRSDLHPTARPGSRAGPDSWSDMTASTGTAP